jgi:PAS domain S-box-containing protein
MKDQSRTKQALIQELASLRQRIAELEQSESVCKPVEYALWKSKEELQWLFKSMINAFVLFESVFDDNGHFISYRFVYINNAYERITGVKNEEVKGKTVHEVWPETEPEWIKRYGEVAVTGAFQTFESYHAPTKKFYYCNVYRPWDTKDRFCVFFEDITERKQAEEALRRSEENFRRSLDESPLGVRIVTIEGETIYANRAILDIHGYDSIEELKTTPVEKRYTPESFAEFQIRREKRKRGDDASSEYEIKIIKKDGKIRHLHVFRKDILWNGEEQIQVIYQDITERKRAEEVLRTSEAHYRLLAEHMTDIVWMMDLDLNVTWLSPSAMKARGFSVDEIVALPLDRQLTPDSLRKAMNWLGKLMRLEKDGLFSEPDGILSRELAFYCKDGSTIVLDCAFQFIRDEQGKATGILAEGKDITSRKQAEEVLRQSEEKYRDIFDETVKGIYRSTPAGHFLIINPAFARICGYASPEEMKEKVTDIANHLYANPEDRLRFQKLIAAEGEVKGFEVQFKNPTRGLVWISINSKAFRDEQGNIQYYGGAIEDITSRKQMEEGLRTSRSQLRALATRLQQIREEERVLISREIHDEMGGGLTGLKMDLSWLLRKMDDADPDEERVALMDKIHTSNALIDQMIKVVRRISADLRPSVLDDLGLIAALSWQAQEFTSRREIQCEFVTPIDYINLEAETATAVFRIFQEALTNVVRHSQATKVAVVLREDERSLFGEESLVLEIRDNGRGITEEEILNPESLGLLGMKERVLAFGGDLRISGELDSGTTLILKIPQIQGEPS